LSRLSLPESNVNKTLHPALSATCRLVYTAGLLIKTGHTDNAMNRLTLIVLLLCMTDTSLAAFEVTQGASGQCFNVVSELKRNWMQVKRHLLPDTADIDFPESENFVCVSNAQIRNAMETRTVASSSLRCFNNPMSRGLGFCCDESLVACAQLNPYLFPEVFKRPGADRVYEPPASLWVKPPEDGEQWKSN